MRSLRLLAAALALAGMLAPSPARALPDPYKQHMDNGVKLFQDRNYGAAIAEFQAAYQAKPKASPLVDIALCEKALFDYPKAITALESALAKHADTMDAGDKQAAEGAIVEMRALLAHVRVTVVPPHAIVVVDGEEQPAGVATTGVPLGPGAHKISARADGFVPIEKSVSVASGENVEVVIALAPEKPAAPTIAPTPTPPPVAKKDDVAPARLHGVYLFGTVALLFPTKHPTGFLQPQINSGASGGLRVGYQLNGTAGFDLMVDHSSIYTPSSRDTTANYTLVSNRVGLELRMMTPGTIVRGVGVLGGGVVYDDVTFSDAAHTTMCPATCHDGASWNPFLLLEAGVEVDIEGVLLGAAMETLFQSSRGLGVPGTASFKQPIFNNDPLIHLGPALRIGYRFW